MQVFVESIASSLHDYELNETNEEMLAEKTKVKNSIRMQQYRVKTAFENPIVHNTNDPIFEEIERNLGIHLVFKPDDSLHHEQFDVMRI